MQLKMSIITGMPVWDELPVYKICHYPLEKRDYRPFAQLRACANQEMLFFRVWAFETKPSPQSVLLVKLQPDPANETVFCFTADSAGGLDCVVETPEGEKALAEYGILPALHTYRGEDLEGEYWGIVLQLPRKALELVLGSDPIRPGHRMLGGVYKRDTHPASTHYGSLFPADAAKENPFDKSSFGEFLLVDY